MDGIIYIPYPRDPLQEMCDFVSERIRDYKKPPINEEEFLTGEGRLSCYINNVRIDPIYDSWFSQLTMDEPGTYRITFDMIAKMTYSEPLRIEFTLESDIQVPEFEREKLWGRLTQYVGILNTTTSCRVDNKGFVYINNFVHPSACSIPMYDIGYAHPTGQSLFYVKQFEDD